MWAVSVQGGLNDEAYEISVCFGEPVNSFGWNNPEEKIILFDYQNEDFDYLEEDEYGDCLSDEAKEGYYKEIERMKPVFEEQKKMAEGFALLLNVAQYPQNK